MDVEQQIIQIPQVAAVDIIVDNIVQHSPEPAQPIVQPAQPVMQPAPQENVDATLRRSTRTRKSALPSDYIVYLQESDYNIGAVNDPETFSQAMNCNESELWYDAMKDGMDSMAINKV